MYIKIENDNETLTKYTEITNLSYAPETDLTGQSLPIDEFYVDVITEENISIGRPAFLYDDNDMLWCEYWIVSSIRLDSSTVRIHAQSLITKLDRRTVAPLWANGTTAYKVVNNSLVNLQSSDAYTIIADTLSSIGSSNYSIDVNFQNVTLTGYCPEQTARERLQWICIAIGAIVRTTFSDKIRIEPLYDTYDEVPLSDVYWRPSMEYSDYVTDLNFTYFTFTAQNTLPQGDVEWINFYQGIYIVVNRTDFTLHNTDPMITSLTPQSEINIDDVYFINENNVDDVAKNFAQFFFSRQEIEADVINNRSYQPADLIHLPINNVDEDGHIVTGYIDTCDFTFGNQAKSHIHFKVQEEIETTKLIINYKYGNTILQRKRFNLPIGMSYEIENPYPDKISSGHRYVYYPKNEKATY